MKYAEAESVTRKEPKDVIRFNELDLSFMVVFLYSVQGKELLCSHHFHYWEEMICKEVTGFTLQTTLFCWHGHNENLFPLCAG